MANWARKIVGHPLSFPVFDKLLGGKIIDYFEEPHLKLEGCGNLDFKYIDTKPIHYRRFIIAKVTNKGLHSAEDCWAHINIPELGLEKIPLHWADARAQRLLK